MAIYTDATLSGGNRGLFQSSNLRSTLAGHIWDCLVVEETASGGTTTRTPIDVDNGVPVKLSIFTGNGLQERYATIAGVKDKIGITGSPELIKDAMTKAQEDITNFYHKAGVLAKVYQVEADPADPDIFGIGLHQFTTGANLVQEGAYVVLSGTGSWVCLGSTAPTMSNYGFVGRVHSIQTGLFYTVVRIYAIQNVDNN